MKQQNPRSVAPQDVIAGIETGINALRYVQEHILTQENIQSVKDALQKIETFTGDAKDMILRAKAFVEQTMSAAGIGRARGLGSAGVENKLAKSGTLLMYKEIAAALSEQSTPSILPISPKKKED